MTKKRSTKRALMLSALSLLLCVSMLVGSTFAWFTDSVTSGSNIIKSGNLDIVLEYWNGEKWIDAEGKVIPFVAADGRSEILWEPGCTYEMAPIRVRNEGNLNTKLLIILNGVKGDEKLMEAIELKNRVNNIPDSVLNGSAGNQLARFEDAELDIMYGMPEGNIVFDWSLAGKGTVTPGTGHTDTSPEFTIFGHMAEEAGNEYQGLAIEGISIKVIATQQTFESDSFDKYYDKDAKFPGTPDVWDGTSDTAWYNDTDTTFSLTTAEELAGLSALAAAGNTFAGKTIVLDTNMDMNGQKWTSIAKFTGTFDGNGYAISNFSIDATAGHAAFFYKTDSANGVTPAIIKNLTLTNIDANVGKNCRAAALVVSYNKTTIENVAVKDFTVATTGASTWIAGLACSGTVNSEVTMNNCTVENLTVNDPYGAQFIAGISAIVQRNGSEADGTNGLNGLKVKGFKVTVNGIKANGQCTAVGGIIGQTQSVWLNPHFIDCSVTGLDVTASGLTNVGGFMAHPGSYTYATNCTVEGKIDVTGVTAATNYAGGFFADYGWGDNISKGDHKVTDCTADVDIITNIANAGGFVGSGINTENRNKNITLTNCEAKGTVTVVEGGTADIGGFVGYTDRGIYINCTAAQAPFIGKVAEGYTLTDDGNGTLTVAKN